MPVYIHGKRMGLFPRGGASSMKCLDSFGGGIENKPILKDKFGHKTKPYIEGILCTFHTHIGVKY